MYRRKLLKILLFKCAAYTRRKTEFSALSKTGASCLIYICQDARRLGLTLLSTVVTTKSFLFPLWWQRHATVCYYLFKMGPKMHRHAIYRLVKWLRAGPAASWESAALGLEMQWYVTLWPGNIIWNIPLGPTICEFGGLWPDLRLMKNTPWCVGILQ